MQSFIVKSPSPIADYVKVSKEGKRIRLDFVDELFDVVVTYHSKEFASTPLWKLKEIYKKHPEYRKIDWVLEGII